MRERTASSSFGQPGLPMRGGGAMAALAAILLLGACASKPAPARVVLGPADRGAPAGAACAALIEQAVARDLRGAFRPAATNIAEVVRPTGAAAHSHTPASLVPVGSYRAGATRRELDGTFHSLFVDCGARRAWVSRRGGVADLTYWFGPFTI